jgi:hypothetical protein
MLQKKENVMESSSYFTDCGDQPKHLSLLFLGFVLFVIAWQDHPIFLLGRLHFVLGGKKKTRKPPSLSAALRRRNAREENPLSSPRQIIRAEAPAKMPKKIKNNECLPVSRPSGRR